MSAVNELSKTKCIFGAVIAFIWLAVVLFSSMVEVGCGDESTSSIQSPATLAVTPAPATETLTLVSSSYVEDRNATDPMTITGIRAQANQLIVVFVASDGPQETPQTIASLAGGGLHWKQAVKANSLPGDAEIWYAIPVDNVDNLTVTASRSAAGCNTGTCNGLIGVLVFSGFNLDKPIGATGTNSSTSGPPKVSLITIGDRSWVFGVGSDWSHAEARMIATGQIMGHDDVSTENDDDYWVQYMSAPTPVAGTQVTLSDTAPLDRKINFAAVEIRQD